MNGNLILKKHDSMSSNVVGNWMNLWQECADWCYPTNDNINRIRVGGQEKPPQRMIDTCIEANYTFASGFFSHMFPPNTIWARYRHPNPMIMQNAEVAQYFEEVSRQIHQIVIGSNFAQEEFQSLLSLGCFGTNCLSLEESEADIVRFKNYTIDKIRIAENQYNMVDTISREYELTSKQAIEKFGLKALEEAQLNKIIQDAQHSKNGKFKFVQYICPRTDFMYQSKKVTDKPFASYHVSRDSKTIIKESGFDFNPFKVARFMTGNEEVYGRSPMSNCLGTARRTNVVYRSMIIAAELNANPQWLIPDDDSVSGMSNRAGSFIKWRATNPMGKPERLEGNGNPQLAFQMYEQHEGDIRRTFFNHLFRPLDDYRNMTATEVQERMTTDLMTLTPFVARYVEEHVTPIMEQLYYIAQKRNMLPEIPQILIDNPDYEVNYVGRLSLATKSFETMGAINTLRVFGELSQLSPQMAQSLDNVEPDKLFREIWYSNSSSMNALKDPSEVGAERQAIAEQQAMMQQMQMEMQQQQMEQQNVEVASKPVAPDSILGRAIDE